MVNGVAAVQQMSGCCCCSLSHQRDFWHKEDAGNYRDRKADRKGDHRGEPRHQWEERRSPWMHGEIVRDAGGGEGV